MFEHQKCSFGSCRRLLRQCLHSRLLSFHVQKVSLLTISQRPGNHFVGADKELQKMFTEAEAGFQDISKKLAALQTTWKFHLPPYIY